MLNYNQFYSILYEDKNSKEKIEDLMGLLSTVSIVYKEGILYYNDQFDWQKASMITSSIITAHRNNENKDRVLQVVMEKMESEHIIQLLLKSIESICIIEDRDVFVERYIYKEKVEIITKRHCLSKTGFYQCLLRSYQDISAFFHLQ